MKTVHVISPVEGFGNRLDLELVADLLEKNGFAVTCSGYQGRERTPRGRGKKVLRRLLSLRGRFDVNLFLAPIFPEWLPLARKNVLVPNAEGFAHVDWLKRIDVVLAKTRLTERIFTRLGYRTEFVSFTSGDHFDVKVARDFTRFFHSCSSQFKGTQRLLNVWKSHPEWPELVTVINHNDKIPTDFTAPNVRMIRKRISHEELIQWQNSIGFHLCTSEAEGFGHYIMEAMSCRAVTLTTDGPPMNELVQPDRGILIERLDEAIPMRLSHRYLFKPEGLEVAVARAMKMSSTEVEAMGAAARSFFLENDRTFRARLVQILEAL